MSPRRPPPERLPLDLRLVTLALALFGAWLTFRPTLTQPAAESAATAAAITTLTATVGKLEKSVTDLTDGINRDRAASAGELAELREKADANRRDSEQLRAEIRDVRDRLDAALRSGDRRER